MWYVKRPAFAEAFLYYGSTVEPFLVAVEDRQIEYIELSADRKVWHDLFCFGGQFDSQTTSCCLSTRRRVRLVDVPRPEIVEAEVG